MSLPCPNCRGDTQVIDSRFRKEWAAHVRRRRKCLRPQCAEVFMTVEVTQAQLVEVVPKSVFHSQAKAYRDAVAKALLGTFE